MYEVWDVISLTADDPLRPFTKMFEDGDFMKAYYYFKHTCDDGVPCVIIVNEKAIDPKYKTGAKIYESPDNGKTIYEREILQDKRIRIK